MTGPPVSDCGVHTPYCALVRRSHTQEEQWGERLLCDGLHFTAAGQERVWALIKQLLDDTWPDIRCVAWGAVRHGNGYCTRELRGKHRHSMAREWKGPALELGWHNARSSPGV